MTSGVELPPLAVVAWIVVSDPESELVSTDLLSPVECSVSLHPRLELELNFVFQRLLWILEGLLIKVPSLVQFLVASEPNKWLVVGIAAPLDIKAIVVTILDVVPLPLAPLYSLVYFASPMSCYCGSAAVKLLIQ